MNPQLSALLAAALVLAVPASAGAQDAGAEPAEAGFALRGAIGAERSPASANGKAAQREQRALRVEADQARARTAEEDPWAPLGLRVGSFVVRPSIEVTGGYVTNAAKGPGGAGSATVTVAPALTVNSDWNRHEVTLALRGARTQYFDGTTIPDLTAAAEATARLDISRDWQASANAAYYLTHQSASDIDFPAGADDRPAVHNLIAGAAIRRAIGPGSISVAVAADRAIYDPAHSGGVPIDQGDRNNTLVEMKVRAGYAVTPITAPFIEYGFGRRVFDRPFDGSGFRRSATTVFLRGGIAYESSPVLKGEVALGLRREIRDDPALPDLAGVTADATIVWSPTRLVDVNLGLATSFNPIADPASAGSVAYAANIDVAYMFRRNVTLHVLGSSTAELVDGAGVNWTHSVGVGADWKLNRTLVATARATHEWSDKADPSGDYVSDSIVAGLKVQK